MAFRAGEAAAAATNEARHYFVPRSFPPALREEASSQFDRLLDELGPAIESYPTWHPLVAQHDAQQPEICPSERCGYRGLDHTRFFLHGFVTCPYDGGEKILESANSLKYSDHAIVSAETLDTPFYAEQATPVLVRCDWRSELEAGGMVPKRLAVPLMLEQEVPCWRWAQRAETWETMRPYLLGQPNGSRSSLFVDQDTALAMKKIYLGLVDSGMFGALKS